MSIKQPGRYRRHAAPESAGGVLEKSNRPINYEPYLAIGILEHGYKRLEHLLGNDTPLSVALLAVLAKAHTIDGSIRKRQSVPVSGYTAERLAVITRLKQEAVQIVPSLVV